jgi:hypothetical protein
VGYDGLSLRSFENAGGSMKVGDLVIFNEHQMWAPVPRHTGLVIEVGVYVGRKDVKVLWSYKGKKYWNTEKSRELEVINGSR